MQRVADTIEIAVLMWLCMIGNREPLMLVSRGPNVILCTSSILISHISCIHCRFYNRELIEVTTLPFGKLQVPLYLVL